MKGLKIFLISVFTILNSSLIYAQYDINFKYGAHISSVNTKGALDAIDAAKTPILSHFVETMVGIDIHPSLNISTGVSYKKKGFGLEYTIEETILGVKVPLGIRAELDVKAVSIPLKIKYRLPISQLETYGFIGGGYTFHLNPKINTSANIIGDIEIANIPTNNIINDGESFGQIGLGLSKNAGPGKFFGEVSYEHSFQNYASDLLLDIPIRNKGITVGVGYSMPF